MVLRSRTFIALTSLALLFPASSVEAQGKRRPPAKTAAPKPAPPPLTEMRVCVRPNGVGEKVLRWGYDRSNKLVTTNVDSEVRFADGRWVYVFDAKAAFDSVKYLPIPHNALRCPNDKPVAAPPAPPKPEPILPASGPLFPSASILPSSGAFLPAGSFGSSGPTQLPTALVDQFCENAETFVAGEEDTHEARASQFAIRLRDSITAKKPLGQIKADELSLEAAELLAKHFGEKIAAALIRAEVIAPFDVLQKFMVGQKKPPWDILVLLEKEKMDELGLGPADAVPAIILMRTDFDARKNALAGVTPNARTMDALRDAYQQAYADRPAWVNAIKGYFEKK